MRITPVYGAPINQNRKVQQQNTPNFGRLKDMNNSWWNNILQPYLQTLPDKQVNKFYQELRRAAVNRYYDVEVVNDNFKVVKNTTNETLSKHPSSGNPVTALTKALREANLQAGKDYPQIKELFNLADALTAADRALQKALLNGQEIARRLVLAVAK